MLDFASLSQARQGLEQSNQLRHQQAESLYLKGRQLIRESLGAVPDKARLKQAADCFSKGIQANYKNPANFLGMAFLLLLTGQAPKAVPFIKSALELDPNSELARDLLEQAQMPPGARRALPPRRSEAPPEAAGASRAAEPVPEPMRQAPAGPAPGTDSGALDFDALYDATQAELQAFVRTVSTDAAVVLKPAPDAQKLGLLQERLAQYSEAAQNFHRQLEVLDEEFDVNVLRRNLNVLDGVLRRLGTQIQLFEQFIAIDRDLRDHCAQCETLILETQAVHDGEALKRLDARLQALLDHCDSVADRLDELDARKIDIEPLKPAYRQYTERLEEFQDMIEDAGDRF